MDNINERHPDRFSYERIWDDIISVYLSSFQKKYTPQVSVKKNAKEEIWNEYDRLNRRCKRCYMRDHEGKLDRHKVAACYTLAIASVRPMRFGEEEFQDRACHFIANEVLAISVGLSILRAYVEAAIRSDKSLTVDEKVELVELYKNGIRIPEECDVHHGDYIENFANELYFGIEERNISLLSISHEFFLLEMYTKNLKV